MNAEPQAGTALADFIDRVRRLVDRSLDAWLPSERESPGELVQAMRYAVFPGGKRLRPVVTCLAADACGGSLDAAMPAACAVELIHCYSLVHDDLPAMDDDDLRRGRPTCHKVYGEALAILAGDALLTLAFDVLSRGSATAELAAAGCRLLARAAGAAGMVGGQVDDIAVSNQNRPPKGSLELLESMHARKTGALLLAGLQLGGLAADADDRAARCLELYGQRIGLAFQITDDLLDVQGAQAVAGKRVGKDSKRGKLTFPGLIGTEASRHRAQTMCAEACDALSPLGDRAELLKELARHILERDR